MRIVHVNEIAFVGSTLARAMRRAGHDVAVVEPPRPLRRLRWPWRAITVLLRIGGLVTTGLRLRGGRYDVVHVHFARLALPGPLSGAPYVVHCHGSDVRGVRPGSGWGRVVGPLLARASAVAYATPDLEPWVRPFRADAFFLPNPVEIPDAGHLAPAVSEGSRDVLVGVRLDPVKGVDAIAETIEALVRARPGTSVTVIAHGAQVERVVRSAGADVVVVPPARHEDLPALFARHRVAIGQMHVGAIGNYELEAMAMGLPVAATFTYDTAYDEPPPLVPGDTPAERAAGLARLLDDAPSRNELGTRAARWIAAHHGADAVARRLLEIDEAIVRRRHRRR